MWEETEWNILATGVINDTKLFRFSTIMLKETIFTKGNTNVICVKRLFSRLMISSITEEFICPLSLMSVGKIFKKLKSQVLIFMF